jgi:hypothetical protein
MLRLLKKIASQYNTENNMDPEKEEKEGFYVRRRTVFDEKALSLEDE